jgi:hypothetical protein
MAGRKESASARLPNGEEEHDRLAQEASADEPENL